MLQTGVTLSECSPFRGRERNSLNEGYDVDALARFALPEQAVPGAGTSLLLHGPTSLGSHHYHRGVADVRISPRDGAAEIKRRRTEDTIYESLDYHLCPGVASDRASLAGKGSRSLLTESSGGLGLDTERIAQEIDLACRNRWRKGQGNAIPWELVFNHHLRHQGDAHIGRNQLGNGVELGASERQVRLEMIGSQKPANLGRQAMDFVQEQELFRGEIAPTDLFLLGEAMSPGQQN